MKPKDLAQILNGREYLQEMTKEEELIAMENGLVVVFGYSDDNVELRGFVNDEIGAYEGTDFYFNEEGLLQNRCDCDDCPYYKEMKSYGAKKISAIWDKEGFSWIFETEIPHEQFVIVEGDENYCRGIVFAIEDLCA